MSGTAILLSHETSCFSHRIKRAYQKRGVALLHLSRIPLQKELGNLEPEVLSFHLLQQDPYFSFLPVQKIPTLLSSVIHTGESWALPFENKLTLTSIANRLTKEGVQILLKDQKEENPSVRAEYDRKRKQIRIYRNSFTQLDSFFRQYGYEIDEEEWILLHVTHEFFHHLENNPKRRRSFPIPKVTFRKLGPFRFRQPIRSVREIAAHAFTKRALKLPWSPYLMDLWIQYHESGHRANDIRQAVLKIKETYDIYTSQTTEEEIKS